MAGSLKLDGNEFLVKEGGQFKITNSELKLKSSGNTVVDSSGNAVISESGGTVTLNKGTLGSAVSLATATFPPGHVIQVVQQQHTSGASISTNSTSIVATTFLATLPSLKSNTSKIFISLNGGEADCNGAGTRFLYFYQSIAGASYTAIPNAVFEQYIGNTATSRFPTANQWLYTPGTTQQVSIQVYFKVNANTIWLTNGRVLTLTLMEISA